MDKKQYKYPDRCSPEIFGKDPKPLSISGSLRLVRSGIGIGALGEVFLCVL